MSRLTSLLFATTLLGSMTQLALAGDLPRQGSTEQMQFISGKYRLTDGRDALLVTKNNRLYLKIGQDTNVLEPTGRTSWATKDRTVTVVFQQNEPDDEIVLNFRNDSTSAAPTRLASNDKRGRGAVD